MEEKIKNRIKTLKSELEQLKKQIEYYRVAIGELENLLKPEEEETKEDST